MDGNQTFLIDKNGKARMFAFDYSFWSHDQFVENEDGVMIGITEKYADQNIVYHHVGREILENA